MWDSGALYGFYSCESLNDVNKFSMFLTLGVQNVKENV